MSDLKTAPYPRQNPDALIRLKRATLWLLALFFASGASLWVLAAYAPGILLTGISAFLAWCVFAAFVQVLCLRKAANPTGPLVTPTPSRIGFVRRWKWGILGVAAVALWSWFHWGLWNYFHWGFSWQGSWQGGLRLEQKTFLQIATALLLASGCLLHFFSQFAVAVQKRLETRRINSLLYLARIAFWSCLGVAGGIFLFLSTMLDLGAWLGWPLLALTLILLLEPVALRGAAFYQPEGSRGVAVPSGQSLLLDAVFGRGEGIRSALVGFERLAGMKIGEMWLPRFLRRTIGWIVLGSLVLGWLSTCLTMVPAGSRGVRLFLGRYEEKALGPGLHVAYPLPLGRIVVIPTEQVRTVSLGFEQDLNEPVLWDKTHALGEENLLVGNGESLLTINVPILYRVSDAVAYVTASSNPAQAMADLAERKLLYIMASRDGFAVMINDRTKIADDLRVQLQQEINKLGLGIQVEFVGLQDVHPPVDVAPAYQAVVSAQEEMEAMIDNARALRAKTLPATQAQANGLTSQATATATASRAEAQGIASRFLSLAKENAAHSDLLQLRMRLETVEQTLNLPSKTILVIPQPPESQQYLLDLR